MWWWWFFTCIHNCVSIFWFITKNIGNPKMSFNRQLNMFFGKIIFFTCDLHLKLDILNPLNTMFCQMVKKMSPLFYNLFLQNFKSLKILYDLVFHQIHLMNVYFHRRGHVFVVQNIWNQSYDLKHSFWFYFFKTTI